MSHFDQVLLRQFPFLAFQIHLCEDLMGFDVLRKLTEDSLQLSFNFIHRHRLQRFRLQGLFREPDAGVNITEG